jgi:alkanesulfonate monooxygenase SsuD/methylene tetrahydromethanopterin reductase-like flavin-dependent oxidoreductase (luciferase family)
MKFMYFPLPALPGTLEDRRRERPIAYRTERWQKMFDEVVELARIAEDLGFEAITFPEHHLATEGLEIGSIPLLTLYVAMHTKTIKVGPVGYVLPGWDPLRLAVEIGWLDQLTKGRTVVGMARGYQTRWLNQMGQFLHVGATVSDQSEVDQANRRAFEEVFHILRLAWKDEAFRFKGEFYQYPYPYEEGTPWAPTGWTTEFGDPGEVGKDGRLHKISVVPKPYQKPHPKVFQAFSVSEATIRWCAKEDIVPMILMSHPDVLRGLVDAYVEAAAQAGRKLERGKSVGVLRQIYFGNSDEEIFRLSETGAVGLLWKRFWGHFGFWEAFKSPEEQQSGRLLSQSDWTIDRLRKFHYVYAGSVKDVRKGMDALVEAGNPEYFAWLSDQGMLPLDVVKQQLRTFGEQVLPHYRS